jgi:hypothetical protein
MIVFDFIYFCIYSFVPDKAIFGKRDVACTFFSSFSAMFLMGVCNLSQVILNYRINPLFLTVILFGGLFILVRIIYLNPAKFRSMHRRFRKIPKWFFKMIGIMYILFCAVSFIFCMIQVTLMVNSA